jgi:sulfite reductase (ferredoxin)
MAEETKKSKQEIVKEASNYLRGTIAEDLARDTPKFDSDDAGLLKFHGTYQQDDRDARKHRKPGDDKSYIFMVRIKVPGGKLTADQFLTTLSLGERLGNGTLRITTRKGFQLHGVVKRNLREAIHEINKSLLTTLAACGDVERNVMCCPAPHHNDGVHDRLQATADAIARHLAPQTRAYFEIWIDGEKAVEQSAGPDIEPIYGNAYLPRKFKTGIALPEDNCIDVYTQDIGLLAVVEAGQLIGYNVLVGGGLGTTPSDPDTFPRLGDRMAFVPYDDVLPVVTAIVLVQRDFGNRAGRKLARMKYLVHDWGLPRFKAKVEDYLGGRTLADPHPVDIHGYDDHLGWHPQGDGKSYFGVNVENGRIKDDGSLRLKSGLRRLFERFRMPARLTPQQSLLLCDLEPEWKDEILALLREHGIKTHEQISNARRFAMACPALPTCGLAITESERVMPSVVNELEVELATCPGRVRCRFSSPRTQTESSYTALRGVALCRSCWSIWSGSQP